MRLWPDARGTDQENAAPQKTKFGIDMASHEALKERLQWERLATPLIALVVRAGFRLLNSNVKERQDFPNHSSERADKQIQRQGRIQVLVIQWLQAHITLFSKYFASFPHGTCSLSDSRRYLALDEIYHLIYVPIPGNVTLRLRTLRSTAQVLNWAVTIRCISFQKTYTCRTTSNASRYYNAKQ